MKNMGNLEDFGSGLTPPELRGIGDRIDWFETLKSSDFAKLPKLVKRPETKDPSTNPELRNSS